MVRQPNSVPNAFGAEFPVERSTCSVVLAPPSPQPSPAPAGEGWGEGGAAATERIRQFDNGRSRPNRARRNVEFARHLRRNMTDPERVLWRVLRNRWFSELKFRRQHPFPPYVLDFVCIERKLIVELDGGRHALTRHRDAKRDAFFAEIGFTTLRLSTNDLYQRRDDVLNVIWVAAYGQSKHFPPIQHGEILRYT